MSLRRNLPHLSASAFSALLEYAKHNDVSELASSRTALARAKHVALDDTPYGPLLIVLELKANPPLVKPIDLVIVDPMAYLHIAFKATGGFSRLLSDMHQRQPSSVDSPWRLALYSDEVAPGNALKSANTRKVWVVYFSFLEFGIHLENELAWIPMLAEPTESVKDVQAGISQVFAAALKLFFGSHQHDMRHGLHLVGPDGSFIRLYAEFSMALQDGAAHKHIWSCKGDGGTKFCMLCKNLVSRASPITQHDGSHLLVCGALHEHQLAFASDEDIKGSIRRLCGFKRTATKTEFQLREQAIGFVYKESSLLQDEQLNDIVKPASQFCHDWMHGIFSGGVFNTVLFRLLHDVSTVQRRQQVWADLDTYVCLWTWPFHRKFKPKGAFEAKRVKAYKQAEQIKCAASEGLSMLPVIGLFISLVIVPTNVCLDACLAFLALCDVVEQLETANLGLANESILRTSVEMMLAKCDSAGWADHMIPKFHLAIHYPRNLAKWNMSPSCFALERKHKLVKRYGEDIYNTVDYALSVMSEVIGHQLHSVMEPNAFDISAGLIDPKPATKKVRDFMCAQTGCRPDEVFSSKTGRTHSLQKASASDVVLIKSTDGVNFIAGQLWQLIRCAGKGDYALVSVWRLHSSDMALGHATWHKADAPHLLDFDLIVTSVIWTEHQPGLVRTLIPFLFRGLSAVDA